MNELDTASEHSQSEEDLRDWNRIAARATPAQTDPNIPDRIYQQFEDPLWQSLGDVRRLDILDLGCGNGWLSRLLHDAGANVVGVDGAADFLAQARLASPKIEFIEHNLALGLPSPGRTFDRSVSYMVLMDIPDIERLIAAVRAALKEDGRFIFTLPHPCFFNTRSRRDETTGEMFRMVKGYLREGIWRLESFGGHNHYHRSLTEYCELLRQNRFAVTRLYEPQHIPGPNATDIDFWANIPVFMLVEAIPIAR